MIQIDDVKNAAQLRKIRVLGLRTPEFAAGERVLFWPLETLSSWLTNAGGPLLVAMDDHLKIVGFLLGTFHGVGIATIENIHVVARWRRRGIARMLIGEFEKRASDARMTTLRSLCHEANAAGAAVLDRCDYRRGSRTAWLSCRVEHDAGLIQYRVPVGLSVRKAMSQDIAAVTRLTRRHHWLPWGLTPQAFPLIDWMARSDCTVCAAFDGAKMVGLGIISVHQAVCKASIECLGVIPSSKDTSELCALMVALLGETVGSEATYISAHPDELAVSEITSLVAAGFVRQRTFVPYSKLMREGMR